MTTMNSRGALRGRDGAECGHERAELAMVLDAPEALGGAQQAEPDPPPAHVAIAPCQRLPHIEPPGSGKLRHSGSPIMSQAGSPILSHPGSAIGSHPVERDRIPSSFSPSPEILAGAHQLQEVTSGGRR